MLGLFIQTKLKYYLLLHFIVLIWGFTGILGGVISVSANQITFFRTGIAFLSLLLLGFFIRNKSGINGRQLAYLILTGIIVGLHWITFFYAIKISTISIAVVCMSASTLFTSFLEPILFKRKFALSELILSIAVSIGVIMIFGFEINYAWGILIGLISAIFSALFNTINGLFIKNMHAVTITKYEMLGGFITAWAFLIFNGEINQDMFVLTSTDWVYLFVLAIVCTSFAFIMAVWVMKFVTPFTVSISVNLEPVYTIIIALLIDWYNGTSNEKMSPGFYAGGLVIILSILFHARLKFKKSQTNIS